MCECCPQCIESDRLIHDARDFFFPVALHTVLFREQTLERVLIGLGLLTYTALLSSALGHVEVSLLAWLAEDAANSGAGKKGVSCIFTLSCWHAA